ncbi:putative disease resistance protein Aig2 [Penicillium brasilianum]|uniref:Putative gamma-glutamylcyclotransferase n=1 Tax=Penicillium brasilianum TaxID=104259 RepID=A0A1S9RKQ8_PENBI|nr:putative disease resistance protein Aig2 [Penicillium brasilianum]
MGDHILFCYGTLMAPQMLHRVIHGSPKPEPWQKSLIRFQPALLHGYRRHRVRGADYPGIVAESDPESTSDTAVLGVLVYGLTDGDIYRLDKYEGSEYVKETVKVRTARASAQGASKEEGDVTSERQLRDMLIAAGSQVIDEGEEVMAATYVWIAGKERLEAAEWDFETFKRDKLAWWVGAKESEW